MFAMFALYFSCIFRFFVCIDLWKSGSLHFAFYVFSNYFAHELLSDPHPHHGRVPSLRSPGQFTGECCLWSWPFRSGKGSSTGGISRYQCSYKWSAMARTSTSILGFASGVRELTCSPGVFLPRDDPGKIYVFMWSLCSFMSLQMIEF